MSGEGDRKRFVLRGSILTGLACVGIVLVVGWLLLRMPVWLIIAEGVGLAAIVTVSALVATEFVTRYPPRFAEPAPPKRAADDEKGPDSGLGKTPPRGN